MSTGGCTGEKARGSGGVGEAGRGGGVLVQGEEQES